MFSSFLPSFLPSFPSLPFPSLPLREKNVYKGLFKTHLIPASRCFPPRKKASVGMLMVSSFFLSVFLSICLSFFLSSFLTTKPRAKQYFVQNKTHTSHTCLAKTPYCDSSSLKPFLLVQGNVTMCPTV